MISDLYLGTSRRTRPLPRGVAGHVAYPIRSIQISEIFTTEYTEATDVPSNFWFERQNWGQSSLLTQPFLLLPDFVIFPFSMIRIES